MGAIQQAYEANDISDLLAIFPPAWAGVAARIMESGAELSPTKTWWAPRWSPISPTKKKGENVYWVDGDSVTEGMVKSVIYRVHDCIHQLWGIPISSEAFSEDDFYIFKRSTMCGEVAALTMTEFFFCQHLLERFPQLHPVLWKRNALPMLKVMNARSAIDVAIRLDGILHKHLRPRWVRNDPFATAFADDYVPMLEKDRAGCDKHWAAIKEARWRPTSAPNTRYSQALDGLELTVWMIEDFLHLMHTDPEVDTGLREFNRQRRRSIEPPPGWTKPKGMP